jgi:hypothetical protein
VKILGNDYFSKKKRVLYVRIVGGRASFWNSDSGGGDSDSGKKNNNQLKAAVEKEATMAAAGARGERRQGRQERRERRASRKKMQTGARLVLVTRREHTEEIHSTTNSTKIVPETSSKNAIFFRRFPVQFWYYLWYWK